MAVDFDPAECELFIDACTKKYSTEDLFRFVIGVDESGCPYVKTNGPTAAQVVALTEAINALAAAINP
jgi:hypothetical protein